MCHWRTTGIISLMATKELTEILQTAGAAGDASIGLSAGGGLVRRDSVPFDAGGGAANSSDTDFFVGVSVSGDARMFNAIPYIKDDTASTPAVGDLVIGQGSDGSAKQFTVASLAVTLEGESFGTAAFVNTGTASNEVPLNSDLGSVLGSAAFEDTGRADNEIPLRSDIAYKTTFSPVFFGTSTAGSMASSTTAGQFRAIGAILSGLVYVKVSASFTSSGMTGNLSMTYPLVNEFDDIMPCTIIKNSVVIPGYGITYDIGSPVEVGVSFRQSDGSNITVSDSDVFDIILSGFGTGAP